MIFDHAAPLLAALILDALLGEPKWLWSRAPHPAVLMGRLIDRCDTRFNKSTRRRINGAAVVVALVAGAVALGWLIASLPLGWLWSILIGAILLAQRSLVDHVQAVADALRASLEDGKQAVAMIVGRDTSGMEDSDIARAAIESAAENLSDGVVAPAFWFLIGGLPGILAYKLVNTADSMIGHRTERHEAFGWAAARLDDALNWIPARLTAAMIALAYWGRGAWKTTWAQARQHRSPNAGWPEAAMAKVLGLSLSGPRSYGGVMTTDRALNPEGRRDATDKDIDAAVRVLWRVWRIMLCGVVLLSTLLWLEWYIWHSLVDFYFPDGQP